jgi:hypothetical protein
VGHRNISIVDIINNLDMYGSPLKATAIEVLNKIYNILKYENWA